MTQIGIGNPRHTVVLPDGTEVTLGWSALTDTGLRREVNEDSYLAKPPLFAVADGMGGHAAGDFASAAVVTRLAEHAGKTVVGTPDIDQALRLAVQDMGRGKGVTDRVVHNFYRPIRKNGRVTMIDDGGRMMKRTIEIETK